MKRQNKSFSILDKEFSVEGTVSAKGQLIVKGTVNGKLLADSVIIAEEGAVYAEAEVASMTIGGKFEGNVSASKELVILSTGHCTGKIVCRDFVVEAGAVLNAEVSCKVAQDKQATPAPLPLEQKH